MNRLNAACLALIFLVSAVLGEEQSIWEVGDQETVRLAPAIFSDLPLNVLEDLESRGCLIPQLNFHAQPHNVIRGHFRDPTQLDWAILCSVNRKSTILVYWGGLTKVVDVLPNFFDTDKECLQGVGDGKVGYSCSIHTADSKYIEDRAKWYGGELPEYLDHEGIDVGIDGKVSKVRYWLEGEWLVLQGAD